MYAYERLKSERSWPEVNGWFLRAVAFTGVQALIVVNAGVLWDDWLASKKLKLHEKKKFGMNQEEA